MCSIASDSRDDVRPTGCDIVQVNSKSPRAQHIAECSRNRTFTRCIRNQRWISRIDRDELARESDGVAARYMHRSTPVRSILNESISPSDSMAART